MEFTCIYCGETYARKAGLDYHLEQSHPHILAARKAKEVNHVRSYMTAAEIATEAARLVGGDRQATHGDKSINFKNTADIWNALARMRMRQHGLEGPNKTCVYLHLTALDVGNMLEALKIARRYSGSYNIDDYIDGAGYAACAGEIASKEEAASRVVQTKEQSTTPLPVVDRGDAEAPTPAGFTDTAGPHEPRHRRDNQ